MSTACNEVGFKLTSIKFGPERLSSNDDIDYRVAFGITPLSSESLEKLHGYIDRIDRPGLPLLLSATVSGVRL